MSRNTIIQRPDKEDLVIKGDWYALEPTMLEALQTFPEGYTILHIRYNINAPAIYTIAEDSEGCRVHLATYNGGKTWEERE